MRLAFFAPLKPPDHPTPSGDRLMSRLLMQALTAAGHDVRIASGLRSFSADPSYETYRALKAEAGVEAQRLVRAWSGSGADWRPAAWFTYHPYYKAPDWIGPAVCRRLGLPYITAEASHAGKRDAGPWQIWQADVADAVRLAAVNFCFTSQDREGLERLGQLPGVLVDLAPFIDPPPPLAARRGPPRAAARIATVAMMRHGAKLESYRMLRQALAQLEDIPWQLVVVGDGPAREEVVSLFSDLAPDRLQWRGAIEPAAVLEELAASDLYAWPGSGEAYGLAYLEAQAVGLPVVAQQTGGIPAVVRHAETGCLTPAGDVPAFAAAVRRLLLDPALRAAMGSAASRFVREARDVKSAAAVLGTALAVLHGPGQGVRG